LNRKITHPFIIDIEASGFGAHSYPIEIGLALQDDIRYCSLICPEPEWDHWDPSAEQVHNIPRKVLEKKGKPAEVVAHELNQILDGKTVFSDGWVVDEPWLLRLFNACRIKKLFSFYDLQTILSEPQMNKWHQTKDQVIEELNIPRHRASNDARIIQETYIRTLAD